MNLRDAIAKAAKFTWKGKQRSPMRCVRFLPAVNGGRAAVYATDGPIGIMVYLDAGVDVPNAMIDADKLAAAVKGVKSVAVEASANESVLLSGVRLEGGPVGEFPAIPALPVGGFQPLPDWWAIERLLHVVSKDPQQPLLQCLHFRRDLVEATDRFRVARAFVQSPWEALVPGRTFGHWPETAPVAAAITDELAAFQVGDEVRFAALKRGAFQNCDALLPAAHAGRSTVVDTLELAERMKRIAGLAPKVQVTVGDRVVSLSGGGYECCLLGTDALPKPFTLCLNAGWLAEAAGLVSTPRTLLGYTGPGDPLRLESGPYVVGLWPLT